ncbi:MAG: dTDP-glucose 4,6-dehydratase [Alphaproteobacteria bacterium]|nr:dTDP-glucose 4,6-dehydratase [Alphaproteobacteria bacterium]
MHASPLNDQVLLVTGGAGFIGANFVLEWIAERKGTIVNLDKLTYAGNRASLAALDNHPRHIFVEGDIANTALTSELLRTYQPAAIVNFAAETHVDRSLHGPEDFMQTNVIGTSRLLEAARAYSNGLPVAGQKAFRFLHISTDEVYGSLEPGAPAFTENSPYLPNSPYAASKAASDHLVRAWHQTYGLPALTINSSNNYGPCQLPEKLIPLIINNALAGKGLPVYGDGLQIRDWLYVGDHCAAIRRVLDAGRIGETYNVGGGNETRNIDLVIMLCNMLDQMRPLPKGGTYSAQIAHVADRPGHDRRYAIDSSKIESELGWKPKESFTSGIRKTVEWYLDNLDWMQDATGETYRQWIETNYALRPKVPA